MSRVWEESSESSAEEETSSSKEEVLELTQETIPTDLPTTKDLLPSEETVATFTIPLIGEMPIPAPEVIASSVIASGVCHSSSNRFDCFAKCY